MNEKNGFSALLKKALAVVTASISALTQQTKAAAPPELPVLDNNLNVEAYQRKVLRAKLVLKLRATNMDEGRVVMHTSHRSHSSHSSHVSSSTSGHYSHSSHSSHSSHYSSSPSYTPSVNPGYNPSPTPAVKLPALKLKKSESGTDYFPKAPYSSKNYESGSGPTLHYYVLGSRTLFKGCKGTDVKGLQDLLIALGYDLTADGNFGETTKVAVIDFQNNHDLTADGRVGKATLAAIQNQ